MEAAQGLERDERSMLIHSHALPRTGGRRPLDRQYRRGSISIYTCSTETTYRYYRIHPTRTLRTQHKLVVASPSTRLPLGLLLCLPTLLRQWIWRPCTSSLRFTRPGSHGYGYVGLHRWYVGGLLTFGVSFICHASSWAVCSTGPFSVFCRCRYVSILLSIS